MKQVVSLSVVSALEAALLAARANARRDARISWIKADCADPQAAISKSVCLGEPARFIASVEGC